MDAHVFLRSASARRVLLISMGDIKLTTAIFQPAYAFVPPDALSRLLHDIRSNADLSSARTLFMEKTFVTQRKR